MMARMSPPAGYGSPQLTDTIADRLETQPGDWSDMSTADDMIRRMAYVALLALVGLVVVRMVAGKVM